MTPITISHPEVAEQWHPVLNGELTAADVSSGSNKKVWWQCRNLHEWESAVYTRTRPNSRCPYCINRKVLVGYNDLGTTHPYLSREWSDRNEISPQEVTFGSKIKVVWVCSFSHEWEATVSDRERHGCPYCAGNHILPGFNDLTTTDPELALEVSPESPLKASEVSRFSGQKVLWRCVNGHEWYSTVANRSNGSGCRYCRVPKTSTTEKSLSAALRNRVEVIESYTAGYWANGVPMIVDIFIPETDTAVEYDGSYWHRTPKVHERDLRKTLHLLSLGYKVVRIRENELPFLEIEDDNFRQLRSSWSRNFDYDSLAREVLG